ncbi:MFS transporter [Croceibacterium aestuarii]|uniref:MFS transporter n=1 Tax=Croceibacterium aestuarii TaxID=3064139 RepID=UPI00272ED5BF|nr:MFS transporter [Croceibacterium sp. D39]
MSGETGQFGIPAKGIAADSTFAPFRWPLFRALWTANLVSAVGSMVQSTAAAWLMTDLTDSHLLVALVQASVVIPMLFFGMFAGALADHYDRRTVMLVANAGMAAVSALLSAMAWLDALAPWSLLLFTLLIGSGFALNGPAWQASVRLQVPREDLPQAISLNSIAFNMARSVGPAIGGLLLSLSGPKMAFTVNALSYLLMILVLLRWRPPPRGPAGRRAILPAIGAALRFCASSSPVRRVLLRGFAFGVGAMGYQALIPLVLRDQIGGGEFEFGLVLGAFGIGSVVTALWVAPFRRRFGPEAAVSAAMLFSAAALATLALSASLPQAIVGSLLAGAGQVTAMTSLNVSMQLRSPEEILGRCLSIFQAMSFGGFAIGAWIWGALSDAAGLAPALLAASAWLLAALVTLRIFAPMPQIGEGTVASRPAA